MATPRVTIDQLPAKTTPAGTELIIIQDAGVTKKITLSNVTSTPSAPLTAHINNPVDAHDASAVSTTDSGSGINGSTVQSQLGQLAAKANTADAHIADTTDAHMASAIGAAADPHLAGTTVQSQLTDLGTKVGAADTKYVDVAGDTMTGTLVIEGAGVVAYSNGMESDFYNIGCENIFANNLIQAYRPIYLDGVADVPTAPRHATSKSYVDAQVATRLTPAAADAKYLTQPQADSRYIQPATADANYVNATGDTMTGDLTVGRVTSPAAANLLVNAPADIRLQSADSTKLTISASAIVAGVPLWPAADPVQSGEAATKNYVDSTTVPRALLYLPGTSGNFVSAPDPPQLAAATQVDIRWIEKPITYASAILAAQGASAVATACSFVISGTAGNSQINFTVSNGTTANFAQRLIRPAIGAVGACRCTWRGSDGRTQLFTKAATSIAAMLDNTGWTQVGADSTISTGATLDIAQPLTIGAYSGGVSNANTNLVAMSFAATIDGTPFALFDGSIRDLTVTDTYGTRWTVQGTGCEFRDINGTTLDTVTSLSNQQARTIEDIVTPNTAPRAFFATPDPVVAGNYITTPDPAQLALATQLDIRWIEDGRGTPNSGWIVCQATAASANACAFLVQRTAGAQAAALYTATGAAAPVLASQSGAVRPLPGTIATCRVTWRASDGKVQWFSKPTTGVVEMMSNTGWTQVGADQVGAVGPLTDIAQPLAIGASSAGAAGVLGMGIAAASVATTIGGTPFALWRADSMAPQYTDEYGTRWTVNGSAWSWRSQSGLRIGSPPVGGLITGTGIPEGVITAPVGSRFIDTTGSGNGAIEWIKVSGTGNTGWRVVYGDTGWRDITSTLTGLPATFTGTFAVRRINDTVHFYVINWQHTEAAAVTAITFATVIPVNFRPYSMLTIPLTRANAIATIGHISVNNASMYGPFIDPNAASWLTNMPMSGTASAPIASASQAWPATLPGTAFTG